MYVSCYQAKVNYFFLHFYVIFNIKYFMLKVVHAIILILIINKNYILVSLSDDINMYMYNTFYKINIKEISRLYVIFLRYK